MTSKKPTAFNLADYSKVKAETRETPWTTSVTLTQKHRAFLEKQNVNFSELIRDFVDSLIERGEK